ncbi:pGP6-D family virulence protein [Bacillus nakamurai]|uniref:pGP6-D family virulence protein n=1 Tax=Bacillus nakamurai TaxID=1793963 RepID=UPI0020C1DA21|nr:pGP6-D family virulence protein [Bacillus nakamurai]MCP6682924.1 pGP6-D family virulence protein [Bacillus nakamurai]
MENEIKSFQYEQLDDCTADFLRTKENDMREIVGKAYTDLGRELKDAQEHLAKNRYGCFQSWAESIGFKRQTVYKLIQRYELIIHNMDNKHILEDLPVSLTYEIARPSAESTEPKRQAKQAVLNGEVKTLKEYRELLAEKEAAETALKQAESQRTLAEQEADILREKLERVEEAEPEVRTEYVEVPTSDPKIVAENERYKELFGDVSMYEGKTTRVTNGDAITYTVREFSEDVRKFVEKYGHLTHFAQEFNGMIDEGKEEYGKAIHAMQTFLNSMRRVMGEKEAVIING